MGRTGPRPIPDVEDWQTIAKIVSFFALLLNGWLLFALHRLTAVTTLLVKELNDMKVHTASNFVPLARFERLEQKVDELGQRRP